jgi:hypothetical protein
MPIHNEEPEPVIGELFYRPGSPLKEIYEPFVPFHPVFSVAFEIFANILKTHATNSTTFKNDHRLKRAVRTLFEQDLNWNVQTEEASQYIQNKITLEVILKEKNKSIKDLLFFLTGLHSEKSQRFNGWIYEYVMYNGTTWIAENYEDIVDSYMEAIETLTLAIDTLQDTRNLTSRRLFVKWFGNRGGLSSRLVLDEDMKSMAAQYRVTRDKVKAINPRVLCKINTHDHQAFAMVNPNDKWHAINLGKFYWEAPGFDKQQTFIHEWSHFFFNPKTEDWEYGAEKCMAMAKEDTARVMAIAKNDNTKTIIPRNNAKIMKSRNNADSVGYFAIDVWLNKYQGRTYLSDYQGLRTDPGFVKGNDYVGATSWDS